MQTTVMHGEWWSGDRGAGIQRRVVIHLCGTTAAISTISAISAVSEQYKDSRRAAMPPEEVSGACLSTKAASMSSRRTIDIGGVVLRACDSLSSVNPASERLSTQMSYPSSPVRRSNEQDSSTRQRRSSKRQHGSLEVACWRMLGSTRAAVVVHTRQRSNER